jgi:4-hydroxybenzoate polyprenyltransferase
LARDNLVALLKASHFGPTLAVTTVSFLLAASLWWEGPAFVIAFGVFLGQLLVGFTNDLVDYPDDLKHNRLSKPLVSGELTTIKLRRAINAVIPLTLLVNLVGPLGVKGGLIYLFGVGMGVSYNFYFKSTLLSPIPYALAFAALVSSIIVSTDRTPPLWFITAAVSLGVAAHFANVLKDIDQDLESKIKGLPQQIGKKGSRVITSLLLIIATLILHNANSNMPLLIVGLVFAIITSFAPNKIIFKSLMITAVVDVMMFISATNQTIGSFTV